MLPGQPSRLTFSEDSSLRTITPALSALRVAWGHAPSVPYLLTVQIVGGSALATLFSTLSVSAALRSGATFDWALAAVWLVLAASLLFLASVLVFGRSVCELRPEGLTRETWIGKVRLMRFRARWDVVKSVVQDYRQQPGVVAVLLEGDARAFCIAAGVTPEQTAEVMRRVSLLPAAV